MQSGGQAGSAAETLRQRDRCINSRSEETAYSRTDGAILLRCLKISSLSYQEEGQSLRFRTEFTGTLFCDARFYLAVVFIPNEEA